MSSTAMLRAGYGGLALSFAAIAASAYVPALLFPGLAIAILAGILLALSGDHLPKWAGITVLGYFALIILVFLASTPITIDKGDGYFINSSPSPIAREALHWLGVGSPLMLVGSALVASWERELAPRALLWGALAGFALAAVLSVLLVPRGDSLDAARDQGELVRMLFALSAATGAIGAFWSAARANEFA